MATPTSSALTAPGTSALNLQVSSVDDLDRLARVFAASGLFGRDGNQDTKIAECAIRLMAGMEAGISPFASLTGVHIIKGRPAFSANLLAQAVRRHPDYDYRVLEKTAKACRIQFLSRGEILGVEAFTMEMAERAGLLSGNSERGIPAWKAYPEAMLFARALTAGMRTHCPDALGGSPAYTPEELGADDVVAVTVTEPEAPAPAPAPPSPTPELVNQAFVACGDAGLTGEGLDALVAELSQGEASQFDQLPVAVLDKLARLGVSAETVVRCNGATTILDDELPAAWSA
jgi:hypothetical protein